MNEETIDDIRQRKIEQLRAAAEADDAGQEGSEEAPAEPVAVGGSEDLDDLVSAHDVVLVDFYADWCGPCRMIEPVVETIAAETSAAVAKVDVDANQGLAAEFGVQGVPTLLVFAGGEPAERLVGAQDETSLRQAVGQYT
jgi:thioredoxin 1